MKKIIVSSLIMICFTILAYATYNEKEVEQIKKANNFYGYKGYLKITTEHYDKNYALLKGTEKNENIVYDAYLDMIDKDKQSIKLYGKQIPTLEMKLQKGSLTVIYRNEKIYDKKNSSEKDIKNVMAILHQYPDFIINFFFNYSYYNGVYSAYILNEAILSKMYENYYELSTSEFNYAVWLEVDDEYRITSFSIEDNTDSYHWENDVPYEIEISTMSSLTGITFLDEDGWLK